jgi:hypothetical protein
MSSSCSDRPFSAGQGRLFSNPLSDQELVARGLLPSSPRLAPRPPPLDSGRASGFRSAVHSSGVFSTALPDVAFGLPCHEPGCKVHITHGAAYSSSSSTTPGAEFLQRKYSSFRPYIGESKRNRIQRRFEKKRCTEPDAGSTSADRSNNKQKGIGSAKEESAKRSSSRPAQRAFVTIAHPPHSDEGMFLLDSGDATAAFRRGTHKAEGEIRARADRQALVQEHLFEQFVTRVRHSLAGERESGGKFAQEKIEAIRSARSCPKTGLAPHSHKCQECGHRFVYM